MISRRLKKDLNSGWVSIMRNRTRATLTALGIIIGIAAVITMVEIGLGSAESVKKTVASMGANSLLILPGSSSSGGVSFGAGSAMTLTDEDAEALRHQVKSLSAISPIVRTRGQIVVESANWTPATIQGVSIDFLVAKDWLPLASGRMFDEREDFAGAQVCLIGQTVRKQLFKDSDPVGKTIRLQNVSLKVIGVLSAKGANMMGMDQDDIVIAPWKTIKYRIINSNPSATSNTATTSATPEATSSSSSTSQQYPGSSRQLYPQNATTTGTLGVTVKFVNVDQILVKVKSADLVQSALEDIKFTLRENHRLRKNQIDDFSIRNMAEAMDAVKQTSSVMTKLLLSVALISLLVGGIGIMNIMLVTVTERTKEIGLRMAVGATKRDILRQFLLESCLLCFLGGLIGVLLGKGASFLISALLGWPTLSSLAAVIASVTVSSMAGVIFGFYPAWKAAHLDPIEALRYE